MYGVESGISGFGYYMFKNYTLGRSKKGLQSDNKVRKGCPDQCTVDISLEFLIILI